MLGFQGKLRVRYLAYCKGVRTCFGKNHRTHKPSPSVSHNAFEQHRDVHDVQSSWHCTAKVSLTQYQPDIACLQCRKVYTTCRLYLHVCRVCLLNHHSVNQSSQLKYMMSGGISQTHHLGDKSHEELISCRCLLLQALLQALLGLHDSHRHL